MLGDHGMSNDEEPSKWKSSAGDRPHNGGAPLSAGSLTVGLRMVYLDGNGSSLPMAGKSCLKLNSERYHTVTKDLVRLERSFLGAVLPRKADVQLCPFIVGTVDVVWPELEKNSIRFNNVMSGLKSLRRVPERELSYLAISCLIMYILPPALTSLERQQPWDAPCAIVTESCAVDKSLEALCRASLVEDPLLEGDDHKEEDAKLVGHDKLPSSAMSVASSSTRATSPRRAGPSSRARSRSPPPMRRRSRSPIRSAKARRDRRRLDAISPLPTHFVPGKALPKPIPTGPRAHDTRGRSPARAHSPPRKRARVESPRADPVTVRCSVELRELEERVRQLERENDEAHKQERALRDELNMVRQRSGSMGTLVEMDTWKRRAVEAEERVRSQWDRLRAYIANDGTDALTDSGDDERKLQQMLNSLYQVSATKGRTEASRTARNQGTIKQTPDALCPLPSVVDAWRMLSELAQTVLE